MNSLRTGLTAFGMAAAAFLAAPTIASAAVGDTPFVPDTFFGNQIGRASVDNGAMVWRQAAADSFGSQLWYRDPFTGNQRLLAQGKWYSDPVIHGARIAWFENAGACNAQPYRLCTPTTTTTPWTLVLTNIVTENTQEAAKNLINPKNLVVNDYDMNWTAQSGTQQIPYHYDIPTGVVTFTPNNIDTVLPPASVTSTPIGNGTGTGTGTDQVDRRDSDGDGIPDITETVLFHTNPFAKDSDGDGLSDYRELFLYKTDPMKFDTDGDGRNDGLEVQQGTHPTIAGFEAFTLYEWSALPHD